MAAARLCSTWPKFTVLRHDGPYEWHVCSLLYDSVAFGGSPMRTTARGGNAVANNLRAGPPGNHLGYAVAPMSLGFGLSVLHHALDLSQQKAQAAPGVRSHHVPHSPGAALSRIAVAASGIEPEGSAAGDVSNV